MPPFVLPPIVLQARRLLEIPDAAGRTRPVEAASSAAIHRCPRRHTPHEHALVGAGEAAARAAPPWRQPCTISCRARLPGWPGARRTLSPCPFHRGDPPCPSVLCRYATGSGGSVRASPCSRFADCWWRQPPPPRLPPAAAAVLSRAARAARGARPPPPPWGGRPIPPAHPPPPPGSRPPSR